MEKKKTRDEIRAEQTVPSFTEHKDRYWSTFSHIPKKRWEEIFGKKDAVHQTRKT